MIRVLIADDSELTRVVIRDLLAQAPDIQVVGEVGDGKAAVEQVHLLRPDLVIMDVMMPVMDGLDAVSDIMAHQPTPILVLSANTDLNDSRNAFTAIRLGALDVMSKPSGVVSEAFDDIAGQLIAKVRSLSRIKVIRHFRNQRRPSLKLSAPKKQSSKSKRILAIGASTGGPQAVLATLRELPPRIPAAILVVQHISVGFAVGFADWLNRETRLSVSLAKNGDRLEEGRVFVAPNGTHLTIENKQVRLSDAPPLHNCRPAVDALFTSLANTGLAEETVAVLMTGMGKDGAFGIAELHKKGAFTLAQNEASSAIFGMPKAAIELGAVNQVVSLADLPNVLRLQFGVE